MPKNQPEKSTKLPTVCPHCNKMFGRAPTYIKILEAMSPGKGGESAFTVTAAAKAVGISRQAADVWIKEALTAGLVEPLPGISGSKVYRKTHYGATALSRWKAAGWRAK